MLPFSLEEEIIVFWFRRDLRLHDNTGLYHALRSGKPVLPVFLFDTEILDHLDNRHDRRVNFIHRAITSLQEKLQAAGTSLLVLHGRPLDAFIELAENVKVAGVYANHDYEPYALRRDAQVAAFFKDSEIPFRTFKDQVIFEKAEVLKANLEPYLVFTPYSKAWKERLHQEPAKSHHSQKLLDRFVKIPPQPVLALKEFGFEVINLDFNPPVIDKKQIREYHVTRNLPGINGTTRLSVHLRFGTVSIRELVKVGLSVNETWLNELIWREFFMCILFHFPRVVSQCFRKQYEAIRWRNREGEFSMWCQGNTGFPMVDAGMRELNETGFMHNRVRMVVASFLTKHLLVDWRWGEAYFAEKLIDYDLAVNNGNWQWAAGCGCDAAPYFRIFNPEEQARKFDPEQVYIKRWVPELGTAHYPPPMVDHKMARERALQAYQEAVREG